MNNFIHLSGCRTFCKNCLRPKSACFCHEIEPFNTQNKFTILMHPKEAKRKQIGTGRLSHYALQNSEIIVSENFNSYLPTILKDSNYHHVILYPGKESIKINNELPHGYFDRPLNIFILDGTWACAKKMLKLSTLLHDLPRISFETGRLSKFDIKQQPASYCLSTIESIHELLIHLEKANLERAIPQKECLLRALKSLVEYHQKCAADPSMSHHAKASKPYQAKNKRVVQRKKYEKRSLVYIGD